jgi:hypothetical protein
MSVLQGHYHHQTDSITIWPARYGRLDSVALWRRVRARALARRSNGAPKDLGGGYAKRSHHPAYFAQGCKRNRQYSK